MKKPQPSAWCVVLLCSLWNAHAVADEPLQGKVGKWDNQSHWLAHEIVSDLTGICAYASSNEDLQQAGAQLIVTTPPSGNLPPSISSCKITLQCPKGNAELEVRMQRHFFAPENYSPWVAQLGRMWPIKPDASSELNDDALITALLNPTTRVIVDENRRITEGLTKHPREAGWHDQAALLIGTLGLRDFAGRYQDVRRALCRMTAHLALARALQPKPGLCGQLAEAVQLTLAVRQADALEAVKGLPPKYAAWKRALELRNTGDWRLLPKPADASLLEQLMEAWAGVTNINDRWLLDFLATTRPQDAPDWARLGLSRRVSIEVGHTFAVRTIEAEQTDMRRTWCAMHDSVFPDEKESVIWNSPPTQGVVKSEDGTLALAALSWGSLADFHQRHLCNAVHQAHDFLQYILAAAESAAKMRNEAAVQFHSLRLFPLLEGRFLAVGLEPDRHTKCAALLAMEENHPDDLPLDAWMIAISSVRGGLPKEHYLSDGKHRQWRSDGPPWGTALASETVNVYFARGRRDPAFWAELTKIAPYRLQLLQGRLDSKQNALLDAAHLKEEYASIADFNLTAMKAIASATWEDRKACVDAYSKVAELEPSNWFTLGDILASGDAPEGEAAATYEKGFASGASRLIAANNAHWLAGYYLDHHQEERALRLAAEVSTVFSQRGLETAAFVMERLGRVEEAEKYLKAGAERYPGKASTLSLAAFGNRHPDLSPENAAAWKEIVAKAFPDGVSSVTLADFEKTGNPRGDCIRFHRYLSLRTRKGFENGALVVAVDGFRIRNLEQFNLMRTATNDVLMKLIFFNGQAWVEGSARRWDYAIVPESIEKPKR